MRNVIAKTEILARHRASAARRAVAVTLIGSLAPLFFWIGLSEPIAMSWRLFWVAAGAFVAFCCRRPWQATRGR